MRHLTDPTDLTRQETDEIVALGLDIIANRQKYSEVCKGKKLATLFYEPSTRTRLSFTAAMMEFTVFVDKPFPVITFPRCVSSVIYFCMTYGVSADISTSPNFGIKRF